MRLQSEMNLVILETMVIRWHMMSNTAVIVAVDMCAHCTVPR